MSRLFFKTFPNRGFNEALGHCVLQASNSPLDPKSPTYVAEKLARVADSTFTQEQQETLKTYQQLFEAQLHRRMFPPKKRSKLVNVFLSVAGLF